MQSKKRSHTLSELDDTSIDNERLFFDDFQVPLSIWNGLFRVEAAGYIYQHRETHRLVMIIKTLEPSTGVTNGYEVSCQTDEDARLARILEITVPRDPEPEYTQAHMAHCLAQIDEKYRSDGVLMDEQEKNNAFLTLLGLVPLVREKKVVAMPQKKEMEIV